MVADALPRCHEETAALCAISAPQVTWFANIWDEITATPSLQQLLQKNLEGLTEPVWALHDDLILYKDRVYLLATSPLIPSIIAGIRGSTHEGVLKTLTRLKADFYWKGMN